MCGISGVIGAGANPSKLRRLLSKIAHRGDVEHFAETSHGNRYAVGTNRLAIVDPVHGRQPFVSPDGKVVCLSNGEIYNYKELNSLYSPSHEFKTACDTEAILAGYLAEGPGVFQRLRGMYAVFVLDNASGQWFLARDHLGIKPAYYAFDRAGDFYFSSELKSFEGLAEIGPIESLPPGAFMANGEVIRGGAGYVFGKDKDSEVPEKALVESRACLEEAVRKMLPEPGERVACLLSGGVDSSTVLHLTRALHRGPVEAFTFYNDASQSGDYEAARLMCNTVGVNLVTVSPSAGELTDFYLREGVWMTETFECALVRNAVSYHFLCAAVRAHGYKFALSGEGADEVLGGYDYFSRLAPGERDDAIERSLRDIHRTYLQMADRASMFATLEVRVPYMDEDFVGHATGLPPRYRLGPDSNKWILRHMYPGEIPDAIRFRAKVGMNQGAGYGSNDPGESIYHQAVLRFYEQAPDVYQHDLRLARTHASEFSLNAADPEEVYNFCRFREHGFHRLAGARERLQLNTSHLSAGATAAK